ncbi:Hypothetical predicted protein [Pelobates cultripes]|uniref:Uncharacterized protein n=1 Tax=Pelobates cultripes TaxID=61616 RepID=A0AAD1SND4_PELCU|nr:Hypothetical predicted protein [Pelobates cultripes]
MDRSNLWGSLSMAESILAKDARTKTIKILIDALKKKDCLLVDYADPVWLLRSSCPLISVSLVENLIKVLQNVIFVKCDGCIQYTSNVACLIPEFFTKCESLSTDLRPGLLISQASRCLSYKSVVWRKLPALQQTIRTAFEQRMNHRENYVDGSYSCCGETSRDSVCEKSEMSEKIRYLNLSCQTGISWFPDCDMVTPTAPKFKCLF